MGIQQISMFILCAGCLIRYFYPEFRLGVNSTIQSTNQFIMSTTILFIVLVCFFGLLFGISYLTSKNVNTETFFTGNRRSRWYMVAFAMIGSTISGVTFVSVPGMVAVSNFSYLQMVMGFLVGQLIIAFLLIPLFYKMNLVSIG